MGFPSSQVVSGWVKDSLDDLKWCLLRDVTFTVLRAQLSKQSDDDIWEEIEKMLPHIAEALRDDAAEMAADGSPKRYEIDDEESPYIRSFDIDNTLLLKLRRIDPFKLEDICAEILKKLGAIASVTKRTGDGGIDFVATNLDIMPNGFGVPTVCRAVVIGQAKRYKETNVITETSLREFVGAGVWQRHNLRRDSGISPLAPVILAYWTTSSFEQNAKRYAREMGIWYMDGYTLASYIKNLDLSNFVFGLPDQT
jgi:hypothetical protein